MTSDSRPLTGRLIAVALVFWAAAAGAYGSLRAVYGDRPAYVHVRWAPLVDQGQQESLELRYGLTRGALGEGTTWGYYLTDLSRANIRALVMDPLVEDTHEINRVRFRIWRTATRDEYVGAEGHRTPWILERLFLVLLLIGVFPAGLAALDIVRWPRLLRQWLRPLAMVFARPESSVPRIVRRGVSWLAGRVPLASAEAVALFRVMFGIGVMAIVVARPVSSAWVTDGRTGNSPSALQGLALQAFQEVPAAADWLTTWTLMWGVLFTIGWMSRTSFVMLTGGVLTWALLFTTEIGSHSISVLMVTLLCLIWSRWGDAWSVDAWLGQNRGMPARSVSGHEYGFTIWIPGLVLGVSFAAAALAKLRESGLDWILNGTVKYHFLSDSAEAPVTWGLGIAQYPHMAVLVSFAALAIEALVIVGVLARTYRYRAAAGVAALSILVGFFLFQGLFWPAWWILLLSFLPWHRVHGAGPPSHGAIQAGTATARPSLLRSVQVTVVLGIVCQQVFVSALQLELDPLVSVYDMYSQTYESPEDYERKAGMTYWLVARLADGTTESCALNRREADVLSETSSAQADQELVRTVLRSCIGTSARVDSVLVEGRRDIIDWSGWRFVGETRVPLTGPIRLNQAR